MINQWKIAENGGVGKSVPEKCKTPLTFTLKSTDNDVNMTVFKMQKF